MLSGLEQQTDMLERHTKVLKAVIEAEPIGINNLSKETGVPAHRVRYSLRVLEEQEIIKPTHRGAELTGEADTVLPDQDTRLDDVINQLKDLKPIV